MKLWTIQPIEFWNSLKENGYIFSDTKTVEDCFSFFFEDGYIEIDEKWKFAYDWISDKMREKVGLPPDNIKYPIWTYYQWNNNRKKPDLRSYKYHLSTENDFVQEEWVRIELGVDNKYVLLSDIDKWTSILSGYLVGGSEQQEKFDKKMIKHTGFDHFSVIDDKIPDFLKDEIIKSWDNIFKLKRTKDEEDFYGDELSIQATIWGIKIDQVKEVNFFKKYKRKERK